MRIGIIGAGNIGGTLARHLAKLGHHVSIANSRGPESLTTLAAEIGATPASVSDAAGSAQIVILAIPTKAVRELPRTLFANVPGCIVIDTGNYHPELRDGRIDAIDQGMQDSQWVARMIGHPVVKAFNNIFAKSLLEKGTPRGTKGRIALSVPELVRDLRSTEGCELPRDFTSLPIGLGSLECARYFRETPPFDFIFNLSAIKHVRSEKDVYSLIRMVDTNVIFPDEFLRELPYALRKFFSVSSDKATNPANLMGASKMVMEEVLLLHSERHPISSARFANVAFSDGSLPFGFLRRMDKRQPLSAPRDVRRYFISHEEAGQLCILSAGLGGNREVFFPVMGGELQALTFSEIAVRFLEKRGYEPVVCGSEEEARKRAKELIPAKKWPCHFFDSDTTGEKDLEEFYTSQDRLDLNRFAKVGVLQRDLVANRSQAVRDFVAFAARLKADPRISKPEIVEAFRKAVPELRHVETGRNLDQKM